MADLFPRRPGALRYLAAALLLSLLISCAENPQTSTTQGLALTPVSFGDLPGWSGDAVKEALPALARSCAVLAKKSPDSLSGIAGKTRDWLPACSDLAQHSPQDDGAARAWVEHWFRPYAAAGSGLFTGYYEAELRGSLQQGGRYQTPLYARPDDLISVDLGDFKSDLHGQHIVGKVEGARLKPYDERSAIAQGSLVSRAHVLLWVDDPVDAFFLEVQGSGRVRLENGTVMRVGYDGANGRAYTAIGKLLADKGMIQKPVTMQAIRAWLKDHPTQSQEVMNLNPSYVFFKTADNADPNDGPVGAEGVALTPRRSLAVDPAFVPLGVPVWLDTTDGGGKIFQHLMVAQDTGGAIKGAVRGDVFWGAGEEAAAQAGAMQSQGHLYILLPKAVPYGGN